MTYLSKLTNAGAGVNLLSSVTVEENQAEARPIRAQITQTCSIGTHRQRTRPIVWREYSRSTAVTARFNSRENSSIT